MLSFAYILTPHWFVPSTLQYALLFTVIVVFCSNPQLITPLSIQLLLVPFLVCSLHVSIVASVALYVTLKLVFFHALAIGAVMFIVGAPVSIIILMHVLVLPQLLNPSFALMFQ